MSTLIATPAARSPQSGPHSLESVFVSAGKGLGYDWRSIVAASESADLDSELADLNSASV